MTSFERGKQELSRELAAEKRRGAHTNRKLEQSNMTSTELRESLVLAQDTVRETAALDFNKVVSERLQGVDRHPHWTP